MLLVEPSPRLTSSLAQPTIPVKSAHVMRYEMRSMVMNRAPSTSIGVAPSWDPLLAPCIVELACGVAAVGSRVSSARLVHAREVHARRETAREAREQRRARAEAERAPRPRRRRCALFDE